MKTNRATGFTLIEVLAVAALSAVVVAAFMLFGAQILERWRADLVQREALQDLDWTLEQIRSDLDMRHAGHDGRPWLEVSEDRLRLFTLVATPAGPELREVQYRRVNGQLRREVSSAAHTWALLADPTLMTAAPPADAVESSIMLEAVDYASFALEGASLRVALAVREGAETFSCEVRLPASADAGR